MQSRVIRYQLHEGDEVIAVDGVPFHRRDLVAACLEKFGAPQIGKTPWLYTGSPHSDDILALGVEPYAPCGRG